MARSSLTSIWSLIEASSVSVLAAIALAALSMAIQKIRSLRSLSSAAFLLMVSIVRKWWDFSHVACISLALGCLWGRLCRACVVHSGFFYCLLEWSFTLPDGFLVCLFVWWRIIRIGDLHVRALLLHVPLVLGDGSSRIGSVAEGSGDKDGHELPDLGTCEVDPWIAYEIISFKYISICLFPLWDGSRVLSM